MYNKIRHKRAISQIYYLKILSQAECQPTKMSMFYGQKGEHRKI